jgi:hypothetical protein
MKQIQVLKNVLIFKTHCKTWGAHTDLLCRCCPTKRNYSVNSPKHSHCMMINPLANVVCCHWALVYFGLSWQTLGCYCVLQHLHCFHSSNHLSMIDQCPIIHSSCQSANESTIHIIHWSTIWRRAWGSIVVKVLRYQSDGPGIDPRWCHWGFFSVVPSDKTLRSTQPLKMSTRDFSWGKGSRCIRLTQHNLPK